MAVIAALLDSPTAVLSLRRAMPRSGFVVTSCRTPGSLERVLQSRLVEAVVTSPRLATLGAVSRVFKGFSGIPRVMFAPLRPDDGETILSCYENGAVTVAVEGVDDAMLGEMVRRVSLSTQRSRAMADAPRILRLSEKLQLQVWDYLLIHVAEPARTTTVADRFKVSREHLSRQFGAGGAPNLKRVIDLTRVACAAQLLQNPRHTPGTVARILNFSSASHLSETARRVAGVPAPSLAAIGPRGVLGAFARGKTRSRI
jgi:AraC-like DNA-binding protein